MSALIFLSGVAFGCSMDKPGTFVSAVWLTLSVLCAVTYGVFR